MEHYMKTEPDIRLTPRQCECWSCKANREWRKPTDAEADAIKAMEEGYKVMSTCTCHIDDGPACPVHVAPRVGDTVCITCDGRGQIFVDVLEDRNVLAETCWECKGTGKMCETDGQQGE